MKQTIEVTQLTCDRCGWKWVPRHGDTPKRCANTKCKTPYWDRPRQAPKIGMRQAAEMCGVSISSVKRARFVKNHGKPETVKAVEQGRKTLAVAIRQIKAGRG